MQALGSLNLGSRSILEEHLTWRFMNLLQVRITWEAVTAFMSETTPRDFYSSRMGLWALVFKAPLIDLPVSSEGGNL